MSAVEARSVSIGALGSQSPGFPERAFEVVVLHTRIAGTLRALRTAAALANGLRAGIRLLVLEIVPYPLSLDAPDVTPEFTGRRFKTIAADACIDTRVDIRMGRDRAQMLESTLHPHSVIVMGVNDGWWPTPERRIARCLKRLGHQVVFADSRGKTTAVKPDRCVSAARPLALAP